ncbi:MAG TPA: YbhB/YbcL family Raf kinase inhibitor-like protein [Gemmatimonadaceae bacterium]|nr:YbhB/YbcL family Raf kinase inhibitor-like protein [Gemmatimonadaceae bacterium]
MKLAFSNAALAVALTLVVVPASAQGTFTLRSATMKDGGTIGFDHVFNGFGCTGKNVSPALTWSGAPAGTKSFTVTVYDPDAPTGSGWWHWTVANIPAAVTSLPAGAGSTAPAGLPAGAVQGRTDFGKPGWGGPCPPAGATPHHYIFTVWALKADKVDVNGESSGAMVGYNVRANSLGSATLTALYGR